jgi:hypothetical protein
MSNETDRRLLLAIVLGLIVVVVLAFMLFNKIQTLKEPTQQETQQELWERESSMHSDIFVSCITRTDKSPKSVDWCKSFAQDMMAQRYDAIMSCSHGNDEDNRKCIDRLVQELW